jgi:hypothetical protein
MYGTVGAGAVGVYGAGTGVGVVQVVQVTGPLEIQKLHAHVVTIAKIPLAIIGKL